LVPASPALLTRRNPRCLLGDTDSLEEIGASAASIAEHADLLVLDCIGYDERKRRAAAVAANRPVLLVRSLAAPLASELLTRGRD
jgi:protein AroM